MAYDVILGDRIRVLISGKKNITEKEMFGGLAFMVKGRMFCGVIKDKLVVRIGKEKNDDALNRPYTSQMNFTGKPMIGYIFVDQEGITDEKILIFMAARPQPLVNADLFISYNNNGTWTKAEKLPSPYSSAGIDFSPKITRDGKYFIFSSTRNTHPNSFINTESSSQFIKRIREAGNGLGDIYIIETSKVGFLKK